MEIFEFEAGRSFDRRIGRRTVTPPIDVTWIVPATGLLRTVRERPGCIEEVSLTGAAITGPANLKVKVGDTVLVRFAGGESSVIVRRMDPVDGDLVRFAVELMVVHPVLKRQLLGALSHPDGGDMGSAGFGAATPPATGAAGAQDASLRFDALARRRRPGRDAGRGRRRGGVRAERAAAEGADDHAADADEVRDLVDELRRFMEDD